MNNPVVDIKIKENSWIAKLASKKLHAPNVALVIGKTIHLYNATRQEFLQNERWLKHELCHIRQFEHYGFFNFITKYLWESLNKGYFNNKFEVEARMAEKL
jgi:hypothetical protein